MPNGIGVSLPVRTAFTPSMARAFAVSIETMRACGWGERSNLPYSIRGKVKSSAYFSAPVTFPTASTLRCALPTTRSSLSPAIHRFPRRLGLLASHPRRRQLDGLVDLDVSGAPAKVAGQYVLDLVPTGRGIRRDQRLGDEQDGRRTVAALRGPQVRKRFLQRMEPGSLRHALDRLHGSPGTGEAQHEAGE